MTRYFLLILFFVCQLTVSAQSRRPIDSQHPLWLVHIDVWNFADPQKIIDLIPDDIKPYVCMNLSFSCSYDVNLDMHHKPQNAIQTYKSWASICQANNMWFTCQPASGGHTHILDNDLETFEYFFKRYPNFLGWNYAEQFWGFNEPGDKYSSSDVTRIELFANLVEMSHKYGGFLTVSFCGNVWSHHLNPVGMMKRNSKLMQACKNYPEAIVWLYKYTTSSCFYNNESVCFGPFVAGLANNYGVRYDNCGYNGALDDIVKGKGCKYPVAAGIGTVMEQTCQNGGAIWDGPELIWTEDFRNLNNSTDANGYTQRNWGRFPGFDNAWIDMFRKIIDGTMYIPSQEEVMEKTKIIIYNDVTTGNDEDKYAMWGSAYDNLYKQTDPFNRGNGQWMDNYWYLKKTGRYGTIPMTPGFNGTADKFTVIKKSQRTTQFTKAKFDAAYPQISTGDLFVSRYKNQLVTYTPYTYLNSKKTATANIPLSYNTCESLNLTYGKLSSGIIREFSDSICFYLNNYRSDTTTNVTDKIVINGATAEPTFAFKKRAAATVTANGEWNATDKTYTITVSHNGPVDINVKCAGNATNRATDAIAITPLPIPKQPEPINDDQLIIEAENMNFKSVGSVITDQYNQERNQRGHTGTGYVKFGNNSQAMLKGTFNNKKEGQYKVTIRYSNTTGSKATVQCQATGNNKVALSLETTSANEWKKITAPTVSLKEGSRSVFLTNTGSKNVIIDQIIITPADMEAEKYNIVIRDNENGTVTPDVESAAEGTKVTLNVTPNEGYELVGWNIIHGKITINNDNSFIMPDDNVTLEPIFKDVTVVYAMEINDVLAGTFPKGWRALMSETNIQEYPNSYSGGPRTMSGFTGTYNKGLYWRERSADYGKQSDTPLTLEPENYKLSYVMVAWKGTPQYKAQILTQNGSVVKEESSYTTATPNANGNNAADLSSAQVRTLEFTVTKTGNYVINFLSTGGFSEYLLLDCRINKVLQPTDIEDVVLGTDAKAMEIYDITGKRLPSLQRGLNIIRQNGVNVKKVFIK